MSTMFIVSEWMAWRTRRRIEGTIAVITRISVGRDYAPGREAKQAGGRVGLLDGFKFIFSLTGEREWRFALYSVLEFHGNLANGRAPFLVPFLHAPCS